MRTNERVNKAKERVLNETCMEIIYEVFPTPNYVEFHGSAGGDVLCFRVYDNGTICEK